MSDETRLSSSTPWASVPCCRALCRGLAGWRFGNAEISVLRVCFSFVVITPHPSPPPPGLASPPELRQVWEQAEAQLLWALLSIKLLPLILIQPSVSAPALCSILRHLLASLLTPISLILLHKPTPQSSRPRAQSCAGKPASGPWLPGRAPQKSAVALAGVCGGTGTALPASTLFRYGRFLWCLPQSPSLSPHLVSTRHESGLQFAAPF